MTTFVVYYYSRTLKRNLGNPGKYTAKANGKERNETNGKTSKTKKTSKKVWKYFRITFVFRTFAIPN